MQQRSGASDRFIASEHSVGDERRSSRIRARFWVQVDGVENEPCLRGGDLSITGVLVNISRPVGEPGHLVMLNLASSDHLKSVRTLARVTRTIWQTDLYQGTTQVGTAFEFLPHDQLNPEVMDLLHHVTSHELRTFGNIRLDRNLEARINPRSGEGFSASIVSLGPDLAVLSSRHSLAMGADVQIEVPYETGLVSLRGQVLRCTAESSSGSPSVFNLMVRFEPFEVLPGQESSDAIAVETLMRNLVVPSVVPSRPDTNNDLSGQLSRLKVSSVLSLLELERLTGLLTVTHQQSSVCIHIAEGRMLDVESSNTMDSPRQALEHALYWDEGQFRFSSQPVVRPDRLNTTTTGFLLDALRSKGGPSSARKAG
jgi:hypothetical protein